MSRSRNGRHQPWDKPLGKGRSLAMCRCPDCGKLCYRSRAEAKRAGSQLPDPATRAYRCGEYWHLTSQDAKTVTFHRERDAS